MGKNRKLRESTMDQRRKCYRERNLFNNHIHRKLIDFYTERDNTVVDILEAKQKHLKQAKYILKNLPKIRKAEEVLEKLEKLKKDKNEKNKTSIHAGIWVFYPPDDYERLKSKNCTMCQIWERRVNSLSKILLRLKYFIPFVHPFVYKHH